MVSTCSTVDKMAECTFCTEAWARYDFQGFLNMLYTHLSGKRTAKYSSEIVSCVAQSQLSLFCLFVFLLKKKKKDLGTLPRM